MKLAEQLATPVPSTDTSDRATPPRGKGGVEEVGETPQHLRVLDGYIYFTDEEKTPEKMRQDGAIAAGLAASPPPLFASSNIYGCQSDGAAPP